MRGEGDLHSVLEGVGAREDEVGLDDGHEALALADEGVARLAGLGSGLGIRSGR